MSTGKTGRGTTLCGRRGEARDRYVSGGGRGHGQICVMGDRERGTNLREGRGEEKDSLFALGERGREGLIICARGDGKRGTNACQGRGKEVCTFARGRRGRETNMHEGGEGQILLQRGGEGRNLCVR